MSASEYSSSADSADSSSDESVELLTKPIFIKKGTKLTTIHDDAPSHDTTSHDDSISNKDERILKNLDNIQQREQSNTLQEDFDGVDDTDGINDEEEYHHWQVREFARYQRDRQQAIDLEKEKEYQIRRSHMTEDEVNIDATVRQPTSTTKDKHYHKGAFMTDDLKSFEAKILARDYGQGEIDHSRPTRFKS